MNIRRTVLAGSAAALAMVAIAGYRAHRKGEPVDVPLVAVIENLTTESQVVRATVQGHSLRLAMDAHTHRLTSSIDSLDRRVRPSSARSRRSRSS